MVKQLLIRDVTLRESQEILFSARMTQAHIDQVLPFYKDAGFFALDIWGDTVPENIMRYWGENPWIRVENIKKEVGDKSKLAMLARGRNLLGHAPFPDNIIKDFYEVLEAEGINLIRVYDPLNDADNLKSSIKYIKKFGAVADAAICFTLDPHYSAEQRIVSALHGTPLNKPVFTNEYFVKKAIEMEELGAGMITLEDMNGLMPPARTGEIIRLLKKHLKSPVDFHTNCTAGYGLASTLSAIVNGADIVDTSMWYFAGGKAAPAIELIYIFCKKLGIEVDINLTSISKINAKLLKIRQELASYSVEKELPHAFDPATDSIPTEVDRFFNDAINAARKDNEQDLLLFCRAIESYFNFPSPNTMTGTSLLPAIMIEDIENKLRKLNKTDLLEATLKLIPKVRTDAGLPPLVPPMGKIIATQAIKCAVNQKMGRELYESPTVPYIFLVKGEYGKTPLAVKPEFREQITGSGLEEPFDASNFPLHSIPPDKRPSKNPLVALRDQVLIELYPVLAQSIIDTDIKENPE